MEPNKQELPESEITEAYSPWQKAVLQLFKLGAWTTTVMAMVYAMRS
ncbi:hypothetical protein [Sporomusa acidovorans]|nr:hypothetical protein [Sporomusa acidovorans]OZC18970.1 hypothetical protein SPACI_30560 [Sporomusa acidovorans DSM 3132]SDD71413.1 hypothetical protein SAMN04488499_1003144 [Sporomusa acidovorans]